MTIKSILTVILGVCAMSTSVHAESVNPWGQVYKGAITENIKGKVNIKSVIYNQKGIDIAANIYYPPNFDDKKSYPAIVVDCDDDIDTKLWFYTVPEYEDDDE